MTDTKRASFATEDMSEGGGGLWATDGPVAAMLAKGIFSKEPPNENYAAAGNPIFAHAEFVLDGDGPIEDRTTKDSWSLGAAAGDNFEISDDGNFLIPKIEGASIRKDSKFGTFAGSLQNEGVPKTVLQAFEWSALKGLKGQFKRLVDKERNFADQPGQRKSKFPPSTLCLVKLLAMPGQKAAGTSASTQKTGNAPATSAPASSAPADLDGVVWTYLETMLKGVGGTLDRGRITLAVSKAAMKDANRQAVARRAAEESFLATLVDAGLITYDDKARGQPVTLVTA